MVRLSDATLAYEHVNIDNIDGLNGNLVSLPQSPTEQSRYKKTGHTGIVQHLYDKQRDDLQHTERLKG